MNDGWIVIPNWPKFQHYGDRDPKWLRDYLDQLDRDEYLQLTFSLRGLLSDVRKLWARRRGILRSDPRALTRALNQRVTQRQLDALSDAGFIQIVASKPLALAHAGARAKTETETETAETEKSVIGSTSNAGLVREATAAAFEHSTPAAVIPEDVEALSANLADSDDRTVYVLRKLKRQLPPAAFATAYESLQNRRADHSRPRLVSETRYLVAALMTMVKEGQYAK